MTTIEIDKKTCAGDGRCTEICPLQILRMNEERVPEFVPGGEDKCINCGQCFAFCPRASIKLSTMDPKTAIPFDYSKLPSAEQTELLLKGRRSIRVYKDEPMSKEAVEKLLDVARYAPSGINRQPVSWAIVNGKEKVTELVGLVSEWMAELVVAGSALAKSLHFNNIVESWKAGSDKICRGAPCVVFAYGAKDDPMVPQACTIAATYLELVAFGCGLGACWGGYVNFAINSSEKIRNFVGIPSQAATGAVMMVGHPKYRYKRIPERNPLTVIWK